MTRRTAQGISRIWPSRPTKCPAQGGAGSKRRVLGWRVVGRKRGPFGDLTPETRIGPDTTRSRPVSRSHPRKRGPCSTLHRPPGAGHESAVTRGTHTRLHGRIPASGARRRAEEGPLWGSDPGDAHGIGIGTTRPRSAPRSHPASGAADEVEQGPQTCLGMRPESDAKDRRPRSPARSDPRKSPGPLFRSPAILLHVAPIPAPRCGASPILAATPAQALEYPTVFQGLARVLAHGFVAHLALIPDMGGGSLRALSQNRDSASRVSLC